MLKKLNQIFITKYPLIWNLKLIWILLTAIGMNIIAFITGFLFFNKKSQLQETQLFENFYNSGIVMYFVLCCIIILAIWIYFYIKHIFCLIYFLLYPKFFQIWNENKGCQLYDRATIFKRY